ncbi:MAG TPA: GAF domain-containing sensor histidine kinase [Acidimicrobiales bacterium]|nr:GAF domain-containing sensor histidine kinase [Acidimicrobiales bacterium]
MPYHAIDDPDLLRALLDAVLLVGSDLSLSGVLRRIVGTAASLVHARYGALGVLDDTHTGLAEFVTVGDPPGMAEVIGHRPEGRGILGLLITEPKPLRLADLGRHPEAAGFPPGHVPMQSFLGVPIRLGEEVFGNLYLTDKQGAPEFSQVDEQAVEGLAVAAGIAVQNARLYQQVSELRRLEDRERIARDLHDTVIQRLFATGLSLQGITAYTQVPEVGRRIQTAIDDLDETIRQIRTTIFALGTTGPQVGLRDEVVSAAGEVVPALGFQPQVRFEGPVDTTVPRGLGEHLVATLREALTNVARHARATHAEVLVAADGSEVVLTVVDNGVGVPDEPVASGRGLPNMASRASELGGQFSLRTRPEGGSRLTWRVPIADRW